MTNLTLELNINSASNLANVNLITKMDVYAVISIHGDDTRKKHKVKTAVDRSGGSHPTWNHTVNFPVDGRLARDGRLTLVVRLVSRRVLRNKHIGGVNVPLLELLNSITPSVNGNGNNDKGMAFVTYQVRSPSGKRRGSLTFSYRFNSSPSKPDFPAVVNRSSVETADSSSAAYSPPSKLSYSSAPSPPSQIEHSSSAPPPESSTEYPQLPQPPYQINSDHQKHPVVDPLPISYGAVSSPYDKSGYAYHHSPPPQSSYAYFAPPAPSHQGYGPYGYGCTSSQPPKEIGLGLGLGAGLLGGLMVGDIVSDVANCFDL